MKRPVSSPNNKQSSYTALQINDELNHCDDSKTRPAQLTRPLLSVPTISFPFLSLLSHPVKTLLCILVVLLFRLTYRSLHRCYVYPQSHPNFVKYEQSLIKPQLTSPILKLLPPVFESSKLQEKPLNFKVQNETQTTDNHPPIKEKEATNSTAEQTKTATAIQRDRNPLKHLGYPRTRCFPPVGNRVQNSCAPSIIIAGYEKCGTSALYFKLSQHPEIIAHATRKEYCPKLDTTKAMWEWINGESMPRISTNESTKLILNGCIGILSKPKVLRELMRISPNLKVLVSLRNYADWSYSYYSYRCVPGFDEGCEKLKSPSEIGPWKENRTPTNFSRMVSEVDKSNGVPVHPSFGIIRPDVALFRPWLERLVEIVGREALMIVKQEDLSYSPRKTLASISKFLQVKDGSFPESAYTLVSNTNSNPSQISIITESMAASEVSSIINSGSLIFNRTRSILNTFWKKECSWLHSVYEVHFSEAC